MRRWLTSRYHDLSFRSRLLVLLASVCIAQGLVAQLTYRDLQTRPVDRNVAQTLAAALDKTYTAEINEALDANDRALEAAIADPKLVDAVRRSSMPDVERALHDAGGPLARAFVTGSGDRVVAGVRPDIPYVEGRQAPLSQGAEEVGRVHVPLLLDQPFLRRVASRIEGRPFAVRAGVLMTPTTEQDAPQRLGAGVGTVRLHGTPYRALLRVPRTVAPDALIGVGMRESVIDAQRNDGRTQLYLFILGLVIIMVLVSWRITAAVSGALGLFSDKAHALSHGHLDERITVVGTDELALAAGSFNNMADTLQQQIAALTDAQLRMRRQISLFGAAVGNSRDVAQIVDALCHIAVESTAATRARFWTTDEDTPVLAACLGLRASDTSMSPFEEHAATHGTTVRSGGTPDWVAIPARTGGVVVGVMTIVCEDGAFDADDIDLAGQLASHAALAVDNVQMHHALRREAERDALTGLPNRRTLETRLRKDVPAMRDAGGITSAVIFDIDNFKRVNDVHGHLVGDDVLRVVASVVRDIVMPLDLLGARYGGEEFVVLLPGVDAERAARVAEVLRAGIEGSSIELPDGGYLPVTASFGVADTRDLPEGFEPAALVQAADEALYQAKGAGKNCVRVARSETGSAQVATVPVTSIAAAPIQGDLAA